jgi:hypothetical protein
MADGKLEVVVSDVKVHMWSMDMKTNDVNLHMPHPMPWVRLFAVIRRHAWVADLNWYQVAVVAVATFAISMDLMFPPVRVAIGNGVDFYAGHAYMPLSTAGAVQIDFMWLAVELLAIVAAAVMGWRIGTRAGGRRQSARGPA